MTSETDKDVDALLGELRTETLTPSEDLLNRIMGGADVVLAEAKPDPVPHIVDPPRRAIGRVLLDAVGGWPSMGGLAAATVAGIWIGAASPEGLATLSAGVLGETVEVPLLGDDVFAGLGDGL